MKRFMARLTRRNLALWLIVVPFALSTVYLFTLAHNRYESESIVAVRDNGQSAPALDGLASLFSSGSNTGRQDALLLRSHILSLDMLLQADERLKLRQAYTAPQWDLLYRLRDNATIEDFLRYYRNRVEVEFDDNAALLKVRTQAFDPETALRLNRVLIDISERFINESSHRLAREQMAFAETEVLKARANVQKAQAAVQAFQSKHGILDPAAQAQANTGLTVELRATLARQEAELKGMLGYLNEDSFQVQSLRTQINATRSQLSAEAGRGIGSQGSPKLNALAADYQRLLGELQFAQDAYKVAFTGQENARIESTRKLKSLVLVASPSTPEKALYPRRFYTLAALALGFLLLYGIVRLVVATIEDHQD